MGSLGAVDWIAGLERVRSVDGDRRRRLEGGGVPRCASSLRACRVMQRTGLAPAESPARVTVSPARVDSLRSA